MVKRNNLKTNGYGILLLVLVAVLFFLWSCRKTDRASETWDTPVIRRDLIESAKTIVPTDDNFLD